MKSRLTMLFPVFLKIFLKRVYYFSKDILDQLIGRDSLTPPWSLCLSAGKSNFKETGNEFLRYFIELANIQPNQRILDVGCGAGRMAIPLTNFLSGKGEYRGFDIAKKGIDWCQNNISTRFENFHFKHIDIYNKHYNKNGKIQAEKFRFPFENDYFDFVFLTSVFTHMLPSGLENYLSEISRVLREDGLCLITFFILNEDSAKLISEGRSTLDFKFKDENFLTVDENNPESAICYNENFLKRNFDSHNLEIIKPIHYGNWCRRNNSLSYQDIVIAKKTKLEIAKS